MRHSIKFWALMALCAALSSCGSGAAGPTSDEGGGPVVRGGAPSTPAAAVAETAGEDSPGEPVSSGVIPHYVSGEIQPATLDRATATREGLTVLNLGDDWTPRTFREAPSLGHRGTQPYRDELIRLANGEVRSRDQSDQYLELFGIFPTLDVLRERLADEERHTCHAAIDNAPIEAITTSLRPRPGNSRQSRRAASARYLRTRLERQATRRGLDSIDELEGDRRYGRDLERVRELESELAGVRAVQAHLRCEGYLSSRARDGVMDAWTGRALRVWQSRHMIINLGASLDDATRHSLVIDSRELDFLSLLRTLRERVSVGAGIIEDGTASNDWGQVVDRRIDIDDEFRWVDRLDPLEGGAPDLLSAATDAAARALGWTDPASALAWLEAHHPERTAENAVALPLPELPAYHSEHVEMRVEIDRGDVWYTFPYTSAGVRRGFPVRQRPTFVIYAQHEGREIPLVRWNTTIGSWQPEVNPAGGVGMRYKESDVGERVWRDLIAGPAWLPPPSTPDDELIRGSAGNYRVNTSITGPGYDSAYGLAMLIHHRVQDEGEDESDWQDRGIRSHGSVSYRSILRGYSHGCHRLFNHLAVRLTSFLLNHRHHEVRGRIPAQLRRELQPETGEDGVVPEPLTLEIDNRGFLFELSPPVPVEVLRGRVRGAQSRPLTGFFPLPEELQEQAREAAAADPATAEAP